MSRYSKAIQCRLTRRQGRNSPLRLYLQSNHGPRERKNKGTNKEKNKTKQRNKQSNKAKVISSQIISKGATHFFLYICLSNLSVGLCHLIDDISKNDKSVEVEKPVSTQSVAPFGHPTKMNVVAAKRNRDTSQS